MLKKHSLPLLILVCLLVIFTTSIFSKELIFPKATIAVPFGGKPVTIDGVVTAAEYADASKINGILNGSPLGPKAEEEHPEHMLAKNPSEAWIKVADENLIIAFRFARMYGDPLVANCDKRDANCTKDDSVEFFLKNLSSNKPTDHYYFIGNSIGTIFDGYFNPNINRRDNAWDGDWDYQVNVQEDYWEGEIAIPLASLGTKPKVGDSWGFGFGRNEPGRIRTNWHPTGGYFFNDNYYGSIVFTQNIATRLEEVGLLADGSVGATITLVNTGREVRKIKTELAVYPSEKLARDFMKLPDLNPSMAYEERPIPLSLATGQEVNREITLGAGAQEKITVSIPSKVGNTYYFLYTIEEGKQILAAKGIPFINDEQKNVDFSVEKYFLSQQKAKLFIKGYTLKKHIGKQLLVSLQAGDKALLAFEQKITDTANIDFELAFKEIPVGNYELVFQVKDAKGVQTLHSEPFTYPEVPSWQANPVAMIPEGVVPAPWSPIKMVGRRVSFWGREYTYGDSLFPIQISTQGNKLLQEPIRLVAQVDGKDVTFKEEDFRVAKQNDAEVVFESILTSDSVTLKGRVHLEFDGYAWYEFELLSSTAKQLDKLYLEIPLVKELTPMYTRDRLGLKNINSYAASEQPSGGVVPKTGLAIPFTTQFRVGNENFGFEFFAEDYKNWKYDNFNKMIQLTPEHLLRVRIVDKAKSFTEPMEYRFGLMAYPTKPRADWSDYMVIYGLTPRDRFEQIDQPLSGSQSLDYWFTNYNPPAEFNRGVVAVYPLRKNFNNREGTIEFWVSTENNNRAYNNLFWLDLGANRGLRCGLKGDSLELLLKDGVSQTLSIKPIAWNDDKFHHLAFSYEATKDGLSVTIFADGVQVGSGILKTDFTKIDFSDRYLYLGGDTVSIFDELRVSAKTRKTSELGFAQKLNYDSQTLILDRFDDSFEPNDYLQTKATFISGASAETGAWVDQLGEFVDGLYGNGLKLSVNNTKTDLDIMRAHGVKIDHVHYWLRVNWGPMYVADDEEVGKRAKIWTDTLKSKGLIASGYYMKNVSSDPQEPNWQDFGYELTLQPLRPTINNFVLCAEGPGANFWLDTVKQMMDNYGIQSVHIDYGSPWTCANQAHGCGFIDQNGKLIPSLSINAHREMFKRMYWFTHITPYQDGLIKIHSSDGLSAAFASFCDYTITGEQEVNVVKGQKPIGEWLDFDRYRAYYLTDRQFGVPGATKNASPMAILHFNGFPASQSHILKRNWPRVENVLKPYTVPKGNDFSGTESLVKFVYPVYQDFAHAKKLGYWENENFVSVSSPSKLVRVSLAIDEKAEKVLAIVGNMDATDTSAKVTFKDLGFDLSRTVAIDLMSREVYPLKDGSIEISIPSERIRMFVLREFLK